MADTKPRARVRLARPDDYAAVLDVNRFVYDGGDYLPVMYHMYMQNKQSDCFVIEVDGQVVGFKILNETTDGQRLVSLAARIKKEFQNQGLSGILRQEALRISLKTRPYVKATTYCTAFYPVFRKAIKEGTKLGKQVIWTWDRMTYIVDYAKMKNTLPHLQQQTSSEFNCSRCNRSEFMQICSDDVLMKDLFSGGVIPSGPNWYPVKATQTSDISAMATSHELFSTKSRDGARVPVVSYYKLINSSVGVFAPCYIWCRSMEVFKVNVVTMLQYILKATTPGSTVVLLFQYKNLDTVALKDFFFPAYGTSYISKVLSDLGACTVETPLEERVGTSKL